MFPIQLAPIGKIDSVGTAQVFGYSARKVDRDLHDLAYLSRGGRRADGMREYPERVLHAIINLTEGMGGKSI